jgi:D-alanyl-D-alanine carboxypeptidase
VAAIRRETRQGCTVLVLLVLLTGCPGTGDRPRPSGPNPQTGSGGPTTRSVIPEGLLPFPPPSSRSFPPAVQDRFARALTEALRRPQRDPSPRHTTGITAAVVSADGAWAGAAGTGGDGAHPLRPDSMLAIGSITKTFTASAVVALARHRWLDLDAPASRYLKHPLLNNQPTVRQLLCMTSGIPEHTNKRPFQHDVSADPDRHWDPGTALSYADGDLEQPGTPAYVNSNYLLLGMIIEKVSGLTYRQALRRELLRRWKPARLAVQDAEPPKAPLGAPGLEADLRPDGRFLPSRAWASAASAAGSIAADAPTLASWGYQLYGGRVLPPDDVRQMATVCDGSRYGMGTLIGTQGIPTAVGHSGEIPGYSSYLLVVPERRLSVAVLAPRREFDPVTTAEELARAVPGIR